MPHFAKSKSVVNHPLHSDDFVFVGAGENKPLNMAKMTSLKLIKQVKHFSFIFSEKLRISFRYRCRLKLSFRPFVGDKIAGGDAGNRSLRLVYVRDSIDMTISMSENWNWRMPLLYTERTSSNSAKTDQWAEDNVEYSSLHGGASSNVKNFTKISFVPLTFLIFYGVSGGPFGVEDTVRAAGPLLALVGFLIFPIIWSIPESLITAELCTMFPENGGYVVWVSTTLGPYWGFQLGWVKWMSGVVDNDSLTYLNYRGLTIVGWVATALAIFTLLPFCNYGTYRTPARSLRDVVSKLFFPLLFGTGAVPLHRDLWSDGYFSDIAKIIGGLWNAERGCFLFSSQERSRYGTPLVGILFSASGVVLLSWLSFQEIVAAELSFIVTKEMASFVSSDLVDLQSSYHQIFYPTQKVFSVRQLENGNMPNFVDSETEELLSLISYCSFTYTFTDPQESPSQQDLKRLKLIQPSIIKTLIKPLDDQVLSPLFKLLSSNLFRPLLHQFILIVSILPEDDDLVSNPTPSWPHLQIVYDIFLRIIIRTSVESLRIYIDHSFLLNLLILFQSEDQRERDSLKNVFHRIYSKLHFYRPFMRKTMHDVFLHYVFETDFQRHPGIESLKYKGQLIMDLVFL
ncbi:hypothetical protein HAX54_002661 [Datura stramonium]|uniref:Amino acid permease/ SLC12A domain-containing protein n=1 Tax=Datura stramonium TaxID=4076 RepID=A0ABS8T6E8_DATST|nr:hypothetical protein [Datura stramonium]